MGAIGFSLEIAKIKDSPPLPPEEAGGGLWQQAMSHFSRVVPRTKYKSMFDDYLYAAAEHHRVEYESPLAQPGNISLSFIFPDFAGCCATQHYVAYHWSRVFFCLYHDLGYLKNCLGLYGYRLVSPTDSLLDLYERGFSGAVFSFGNTVYWATRDDGQPYLLDDADPKPLTFATLNPKQQQDVRDALETGVCPCPVCADVRKTMAKPKYRRLLEAARQARAAGGPPTPETT